MNSDTMNSGYKNFYSFLRSKMSPGDMRMAAVITGLARVECMSNLELEDEHDVVLLMHEFSESFDLGRIFYRTPQDAFMGYNLLKQAGALDWEELLGAIDVEVGSLVHMPYLLIEQFRECFEPDTRTVLIAEGEKFTPNLRSLVDMFPDCIYTITTVQPAYQVFLQQVFKGYHNVKIVITSIYEYEFITSRFDLILSVPAFGSRLLVDREQHFMCREYDLVATENLLLHLNRGGRLAILLPARITFAGGNVKELRSFIQDMYKIETISAMPEGLLDWTTIKTYLFTISTGNTDDIAIRRYAAAESATGSGKRNVSSIRIEDETFALLSEIEEQGDWNIDKLFAAQDEDWQRYMDVKRIPLGEVASVFRGKNVPRKDLTGSVGVVNISNLQEYDINYESLDHLEEPERKLANYVLESGDILVPARGTAVRTAVFKKQDYPCIASSNLVVIRPHANLLNGTYLKMFLDSPLGNKLLASTQQGVSAINLSYKDMQTLEIPLPDIAKQDELAKEYQTELERYLNTVKEAEDRWHDVLVRLQEQL